MKKEFFRTGIISILFGVLAVFLLPFFGTGFDFAASISFGLAIGIFLGLAGWTNISIFMVILFMAIAPTLEPEEIIFGLVAMSSQLLVALLVWGIKTRIQGGSHARA